MTPTLERRTQPVGGLPLSQMFEGHLQSHPVLKEIQTPPWREEFVSAVRSLIDSTAGELAVDQALPSELRFAARYTGFALDLGRSQVKFASSLRNAGSSVSSGGSRVSPDHVPVLGDTTKSYAPNTVGVFVPVERKDPVYNLNKKRSLIVVGPEFLRAVTKDPVSAVADVAQASVYVAAYECGTLNDKTPTAADEAWQAVVSAAAATEPEMVSYVLSARVSHTPRQL